MPNLHLSETEIDQLVAYLETLARTRRASLHRLFAMRS